MLLLQSQLMVAAAMTGIIWLVQLVIYPQFLNVGIGEFSRYHKRHLSGIGMLVAPLMVTELALSGLAVWQFRQHSLQGLTIAAAAITAALWLTTFLLHVPLHRVLERGWSERHIHRLISTNWIRTILWSARYCCWLGPF